MSFDKVVTAANGVKFISIEGIIELTGKTTKSAHQAYDRKFVRSGKFTVKLVHDPENWERKCNYIKADEVLAWYAKQLEPQAPKQLQAPKSIAEQLS